MTIRTRLKMHMRMQHGSSYGYEIFDDETGAVIGALSSFTSRSKKHKSANVYTLLGTSTQEFATAGEFLAAYDKQKVQAQRDAEWDAADPEKKGNQV